MSGILEQLQLRDKQVGELIARGDFGAVWVPAFQAKDLAHRARAASGPSRYRAARDR